MPEEFNQCVKRGGRIITHKINEKKYIHVCFIGGKSYSGEVKTKKKGK